MAGLEDRKLPTIPKKNDSLGSDSGLENLKPTNPFIKSGNDSLGGNSGIENFKIPASGRINRAWNGDGTAD